MSDLLVGNWKSDLVVGAWRNGLGETPALDWPKIEKRAKDGFRLTPLENLLMTFANYLDAYDELVAELLNEAEPVSEPA